MMSFPNCRIAFITPNHALIAWLASLLCCGLANSETVQAEKIDFNRDIRPILSENCFYCHGQDPNKREAGLRLDVRDAAIMAVESGEIALRRGPWKLIVDTADKVKPPAQLYNLADDLSEKKNLADAEHGRVAEMRALLMKLIHNGRSTPGQPQQNDGKLTRFATAPQH